ncbi:hypothetical protein A3781_08425 [Bacillus badius]|nr:hypothetical protein A3781_08425 [Bacillus badius]
MNTVLLALAFGKADGPTNPPEIGNNRAEKVCGQDKPKVNDRDNAQDMGTPDSTDSSFFPPATFVTTWYANSLKR